MGKQKKLTIAIGLLFTVFITVLIVKNHINNSKDETTELEKNTKNITTCDSIEAKNHIPIVDFSGKIKSVNKINIISEVNGVSELQNSRFEIGEFFKKGEILLSVQDDDISMDLKSIKSDFLALLINVLPDLKIDFPTLGNKFQKYINNFKLDLEISDLPKTTISKERNFLSSKKVFSSYYKIKSLENRLNKYQIKAPFDGVITQALIDEGSPVIIGQPLGEFINLNNYEIITSVSLQESRLINTGNQVNIYSEDLNKNIIGEVKKIGNNINEMTQSIDLFISIKDSLIKDGMYVQGKIICNAINNSYKIARTKIIEQNNILILKNDTIYKKGINILVFQNDSVIINNLNPNDCIVNKYRNYFHDGMPVN
jgi:membrane fusion protein (multidrug efflux system)